MNTHTTQWIDPALVKPALLANASQLSRELSSVELMQ